MSLNGKRVLVAGGAGNVGRHIVRELLAAGASVVVPSRAAARLDALVRYLAPELRPRLATIVGDVTRDDDAPRLLDAAGPLDGGVASLGSFVPAPRVLDAPRADLQRALNDYVLAHFAAARAVIPAIRRTGGAYVSINGLLAFEPAFPGAGLVSVATAAQAMFGRVLAKELAGSPVRSNEVVVYSSFGRGNDDENLVTGADIGRVVAWLVSDGARAVHGASLHLRTPEDIPRDARVAEADGARDSAA